MLICGAFGYRQLENRHDEQQEQQVGRTFVCFTSTNCMFVSFKMTEGRVYTG
jgi:hypothetical protein